MSSFDAYDDHDALGLAALVRAGDVSPRELLDAALLRLDASNPTVNAVVQDLREQASRALETGLPQGPFTGVPYLIKDLYSFCAEAPCGNGSRLWKGFVAPVDFEAVARLRRAGLVIFGRSATSELGLSVTTETLAHGATRNPWDLDHSSGGSSGGAGAAVAAGIVPAAHGSDGGGSIRIPAACCGLFGLKPTRGRVSFAPGAGEGWSGLATQHALTRSVRDSAALLDVVSGPVPGDPYWATPPERPFLEEVGRDPGRLRIAFSVDAGAGVAVHGDCRAAVERAGRLAESLGHEVIEAAPGISMEEIGEVMMPIVTARTLGEILGGHPGEGREARESDLEPVTWAFGELGRQVNAVSYFEAIDRMHALGRRLAAFYQDYDLVLTPTLAKPPLTLGTLDSTGPLDRFGEVLMGYMPFTQIYNISGQPAVSLPLHWNDAGLPIGVQAGARYGAEGLLIRFASQIEEAAPWWDRRAPALSPSTA